MLGGAQLAYTIKIKVEIGKKGVVEKIFVENVWLVCTTYTKVTLFLNKNDL